MRALFSVLLFPCSVPCIFADIYRKSCVAISATAAAVERQWLP